MKLLLILLLLINVAQADPFPKGKFAAGKKVFEQAECKRCHIEIIGGDGSEIFTRPDRKVINPAMLIKHLKICDSKTAIDISAQDELNLAAYLNKLYYKFP
jgi:cytochrome c553